MNNPNDSQPLAPIAPFHLNFQPGQPQTPAEGKVRRKSEHNTPLIQQPLSPEDSTPVLKTRPTVEATLVKTPAPKIFDQENRPPSSVSAKRGVLVRPKTPKTPKPKSMSFTDTDFEPFVFKLMARLNYPNWRRLQREINGLDHEELMRVFAFFLAYFDENLGYVVDKGGFTKAFNQFRASFRQLGFHITLTKRNFLSPNKRPILPYLKMIVDKVIQKYGSVEKLCRVKLDYEALLRKLREKAEAQNVNPAPSLKRRRRQSVPNEAGRSEDGRSQRKVKRRRTSDATGLISARKQSTSPGPVGLRSNSDPQPAKGAPVVQPDRASPPQEVAAIVTPSEPTAAECIPSAPIEPTELSTSSPPSCAAIEEDVEMKETSEGETVVPVVDDPAPEATPMDVDVDDRDSTTVEDQAVPETNSEVAPIVTETPIVDAAATENDINQLLVEKDMIIQEQGMQIEKLAGELQDQLGEIEMLVASKMQLDNQLQVAQNSLVDEREKVTQMLERLEVMEKEKLDREAEKQELWEKISKTSDQYQATLQQKEMLINDLMNQVSTFKLQLAENQLALTNLQEQHQKAAQAAENNDQAVESALPKVTVIGKIDFGRHIQDQSLSTLRVVDLQKYLKANGLDTKGRKREIVARIEKHFSS